MNDNVKSALTTIVFGLIFILVPVFAGSNISSVLGLILIIAGALTGINAYLNREDSLAGTIMNLIFQGCLNVILAAICPIILPPAVLNMPNRCWKKQMIQCKSFRKKLAFILLSIFLPYSEKVRGFLQMSIERIEYWCKMIKFNFKHLKNPLNTDFSAFKGFSFTC